MNERLDVKVIKSQPVDVTVEGKVFSIVSFVVTLEAGELDNEAIVDGFQHLIDSGVAWQLQGYYGRTAMGLIKAGHCRPASMAISRSGT